MKYFCSEKGNTLIIVLLMIVIFTVAGLSLVTTTFNGVKKTDEREKQIQSIELAEKGIDYVSTLLETRSKDYINLDVSAFDTAINNLLDNYEVDKPSDAFLRYSTIPAEDGVVKVKIYDRKRTSTNPEDLTQTMTIHSEATVKGKTKTLISTIQLGGKQTPEALNYALGSYNPFPCTGSNCNSSTDDGNMFLHGGVAIKGDVYVEGNLVTHNHGIEGEARNWIPSDYPSMEGEGSQKARLILLKDLYKLKNSPNYSVHIKEKEFPSSLNWYEEFLGQGKYEKLDKRFISPAFTSYQSKYVPKIETRTPKFTPIKIDDQKGDYFFTDSTREFPVTKPNANCVFILDLQNKCTNSRTNNGNVYVNSVNSIPFMESFSFKRLSTTNSVTFNSHPNKIANWNQLSFENGAYIGGNLTIGSPSSRLDNGHYNVNNYEKFEVKGPIFVNGNLTIWNSHVKFDSVIYVTGTTTIRFARLEGTTNGNEDEKSLVLFGKKKILIANNNVYKNDPNIIRGFFYSEDLMEIYGVGSNVELQGGVFGRKVVLNATRGNVTEGSSRDKYDDNQDRISPNESRLRVIYNPDLIQNPPEGLPKVTELSVKKIDRYLQ
ncbi:hypothetical protein [Fictibacillus phosphorivorans]|uniref:hypothetical protein n=1 Tax=Fictibacillus phosphorivorans TaxID=1221500 RepID=UPI0035F09026